MENILNFLKKHRKKVIIVFIVLIVFLVILFACKKVINYLSPSVKESVYGDRCDAVSGISVSKKTIDNVKEKITSYEGMEVKNVKVECKLIDIIVNIKSPVEDSVIDTMSKEILEVLGKDIVNNYDIQLFITSSDKENSTYPRIGTHHKMINDEINDYFVW